MAFLLATMSLLSFVQVILRYFFAIGMPWALEVITYMFAWMVLLGMSYCVKTGSHLGIDLVVKALPTRGYRIAGILGALVCLIYSAILLYGSWNYVSRMYGLGVEAEDIPVQKWVILSVLPLGFALLFFRFGQVLLGIIKGERLGLGLADEVKDNLDLFKNDDLNSNQVDRR